MTISLDFLPQTVFAYFLIFARCGALTMSLPGIGDAVVPARIRLVLALALSLVLYPLVSKALPDVPGTLSAMIGAVLREVIVGLAIGFAVRLIVSGLQFAATVIAFQTGLAFAQSVDPALGVQNTLFGTFLSMLAVTLIFATDLHHLMLRAVHDSYILFQPGGAFLPGDFAQVSLRTIADAFRVALQISAPFVVFGLVFYLGVGVLTRLIPQVQVFFLAMPANILLGFLLFALLLGTIVTWYMRYFSDAMSPYLAG
ncbi:MAG: flagellar biosynthetic protein FliR [Pseudomonadota bacterium]|nr:flagellar biosynthetic protein FliR [Pseudomonadota bacterium]